MLLSEAWKAYEADRKLARFSNVTMKGYGIQFRLLVRNLGDIQIEEITTPILKEYLSKQTHLKSSSLGQRIRFIRTFFHWIQDEGYIIGNPAHKLHEPRKAKKLPKALSEEDTEMLRESCITSLEHALIEFTYTSGCRIGEVVGLNRNAIDWDTRSVVVHGKGDKEREVYFNIRTSIWLKKYIKERTDTNIALFVTQRKFEGRQPRRISISQARVIMKKVAKRAGLSEINVYPHKLRHSYSTHLFNNGAPLEVIQSLLGHAKLETTKIYADLSGSRRRESYRKYFR